MTTHPHLTLFLDEKSDHKVSGSQTLLDSAVDSTSESTTVNEDTEYWNEGDEAFFASADLTTPQPSPPGPSTMVLSRWFKQPPSATFKVAYVLFSTCGESEGLGVYYNWYVVLFNDSSTNMSFNRTACSHSIVEGGGKDVCSFRGYHNYELAHAAWLGFQQTGILPSGVSTSFRGGRSHTIPQRSTPHTPQRSSQGTTPHTPQRSSRCTTPHTPQRTTTSQQGLPALPPPAQRTASQQELLALAPALSPSPANEQGHDFWVVLSGYEPGVYQT